jgi:curved DNA-binding protein CbpA
MNGQLFEHPLGELIQEIAAAAFSGSLRLSHERVKVAVYFEQGGIVYATSNLRQHRLSECARRWGIVAIQQLASAREHVPDIQLGLELVAKGEMTPEEFEELLARQAIEVLRPALLWTKGAWDFDPRVRLSVEVKSRVQMRELLMESARRLPSEFIAKRLMSAGDQEKLSPAPLATNGLQLLPAEAFVLSRVDAPIALSELTMISGLPETDTLQALYVLVLGGLVCREGRPATFTPEQIARARAVKTSTQTRVVPARSDTWTESVPGTTQTAGDVPGVESAPEATVGAPDAAASKHNEVYALFARLDDAENHYHVLDLSRDSDATEIKRAYHSLAKRFHPDRFHKDADPKLYLRVEESFARISQAYETLKDQSTRALYDRSLDLASRARARTSQRSDAMRSSEEKDAGGKQSAGQADAPPSGAPPSGARTAAAQPEELYQRGVAALQQGNLQLALSYLGEAAQKMPRQARYRAQYGRALAANQQTRRQAETEFQAAIALDNANVSYRVLLARLYAEMGMVRRAQSELERALSVEPKHEQVRLLLDKLKGKG